MSSTFAVNNLIRRDVSPGEPLLERVLWLSEGEDLAFVIEVDSKKGIPQPVKVSDLKEEAESGRLTILTEDKWARVIDEQELTEKQKSIRDRAWEIIEPLVAPEAEPGIFYKNVRGPLIQQAAQKHNFTVTIVYKYLRKFWQRGKVKNALLPDYENSGAPGKERNSGEKKRGRPRRYAFDPKIGVGINVDEDVKKIFRVAVSKFYRNPKENSLMTAYDLMLKEYFTEDFYYEDGVRKSMLIPQEQKPTLIQFKYWFEKEQDVKKTLASRSGARKYALESRPLLSSSTAEVYGPGSRYQIDATVADVYLVSRYNRRWIIGRPVIYVVIDVFSRMVVGIYIGLEGPSWLGAMMALANAASDKVAFCREYGISISEDDWACHHLPDAILGDRGEMESRIVEALIANLNVRIENAAPYRADWKGIVERHFRTIHQRVKPFLPGYVIPDANKRLSNDYRLDAKLDIYQFTEIIIHCALYHNNHHYLANYDRDETLVSEDVPAIPVELWKWGIQNRSGRLRSFPEDIVKLNLMPTGPARIAEDGIRFKAMRYSCEKAIREMWFDRARIKKRSEKIEVSYDPRSTNYIYIKGQDGRSFEKCFLLDSEERYMNKNLTEVEYLLEYEKYQKQKHTGVEQQSKVDLAAAIESVVSKAEEMTDQVQDKTASKASRVASIRSNRAFEKDALRGQQAFELGKSAPEQASVHAIAAKPTTDENEAEQLQQPTYIDLLRRKRKALKDDETE
jgi:hypothetical protein